MIIAMSTAYHRKKQPEQVRQAILDTACHLAAHEGLGKVSIQTLADAVGVTKGGVFHHFPNKKALVHAVFQHLVGKLDRDINDRLAEEDGSYGSFTRAYVRVTFEDEVFHGHEAWRALCMSMANDPDGQALWADWMAHRLAMHAETDDDPHLEIVRFAADGVWLAMLSTAERSVLKDREAVKARLLAMTRPRT